MALLLACGASAQHPHPVRPARLIVPFAAAGPGDFLRAGEPATLRSAGTVHVPYKGIAPGITDLLAGQVQVSFPTMVAGSSMRGREAARLAVTSAQPSAAAPELPTVAEAGVPG